MNVKCIWHIMLPFKFAVDNKIKLNNFMINDITILPIKSIGSEFFDSIEVEYVTDINDELLPKDEYDSFRTLHFKNDITKKVGIEVNRFVNSYYRQVERSAINQIFNGDDFTTHYQMNIFNMDGKPVDGLLHSNTQVRMIDEKLIKAIIDDINIKDRNIFDELIRMAQCFLENGYFDMAIMNLALAQESFIKKFVFSQGLKVQDLNEAKGYIEKFFHIGLKKAKGQSLKENMPEYFDAITYINDLRNEIAHGGTLYNIDELKQKDQNGIYNLIDYLITVVEDVIEWISD